MSTFNRNQMEDLKKCLYHSYVHDAQIIFLNYDRKKESLIIEAINLAFNARISLTFEDVKIVLSIKGKEYGSSETILSLTVEDDYSFLHNCTTICGDCFNDSVYLLFQMFSGDELHIVSEKVTIVMWKA